jgi:hypothetical protein
MPMAINNMTALARAASTVVFYIHTYKRNWIFFAAILKASKDKNSWHVAKL